METSVFTQAESGAASLEFNDLVDRYYQSLYRFALGLAHSEADACDLTQQTFYTWSINGRRMRDSSKVKTWLFTTLYRAFLQTRRRITRFPHDELNELDTDLPQILPQQGSRLDAVAVVDAVAKIGEAFRAPLTLFYLEDCPYNEIAAILDIPLGTVKSRIARGIAQLKTMLHVEDDRPHGAVLR